MDYSRCKTRISVFKNYWWSHYLILEWLTVRTRYGRGARVISKATPRPRHPLLTFAGRHQSTTRRDKLQDTGRERWRIKQKSFAKEIKKITRHLKFLCHKNHSTYIPFSQPHLIPLLFHILHHPLGLPPYVLVTNVTADTLSLELVPETIHENYRTPRECCLLEPGVRLLTVWNSLPSPLLRDLAGKHS